MFDQRTNFLAPLPTQSKLNVLLLLYTALVGIATFIISLHWHRIMQYAVAGPLLIGLIFLFLYAAVVLCVLCVSGLRGNFEENIFNHDDRPHSVLLFLLIGAVLIFGLGAAFQWIYSLRVNRTTSEPTSYVFLIDDSGSMSSSDPNGLRYKAVDDVLNASSPSFSYMVYSFSDQPILLREMAPISAGKLDYNGLVYGGTGIKTTLEKVFADHESGRWDGGSNPKVILLTDGYATDISILSSVNSVLRDYLKAGISISTVGLGSSVDDRLLENIAVRTGGVYIDVDDASGLAEAMSNAALYSSRSDLLNAGTFATPFLHALLRFLFLTILGCIIAFAAFFAYGKPDTAKLTLIFGGAKAAGGALLMTIGIDLLHLPAGLCWFFLWFLLAATVATREVAIPVPNYNSSVDRPIFR